MNYIPSTEAQNKFGNLLDMAQAEPVTISKKGRPVAVMMSWDEYNLFSMLEEAAAESRLTQSVTDLQKNNTVPANIFHEKLRLL